MVEFVVEFVMLESFILELRLGSHHFQHLRPLGVQIGLQQIIFLISFDEVNFKLLQSILADAVL